MPRILRRKGPGSSPYFKPWIRAGQGHNPARCIGGGGKCGHIQVAMTVCVVEKQQVAYTIGMM